VFGEHALTTRMRSGKLHFYFSIDDQEKNRNVTDSANDRRTSGTPGDSTGGNKKAAGKVRQTGFKESRAGNSKVKKGGLKIRNLSA
jgi:hypothetical protein